jgi:putative phosphoribosyl transferase
MEQLEIAIPVENDESIKGNLSLVSHAKALVIFSHGSGSSRFSARNQLVADFFNRAGISTLLFDLLTEKEDAIDQVTREFRFDITLLAQRLVAVSAWVKLQNDTKNLSVGYFGSSTGAAAALIAAAQLPKDVVAVVSRGGRPDLADNYLSRVRAATLLIVGGLDAEVIALNQAAYAQLSCTKELQIIPGATHLFEESGTLERVAHIALDWFKKYLS